MIKKLVFFAFIIIFLFITFISQRETSQATSEDMYQVIPDEAIRLRILAHSDDEEDQDIKHLVRDEVNEQITTWVEELTDIDEARQLIKKRLPEIKKTATDVLSELDSSHNLTVDYGENVTFPVKLYDTFLYPAGEYEAVLISIGEGKGSNWWCVLFPPLCFLDFSHTTVVTDSDTNTTVEKDEEPVKVKFFLFEWLGWT